MNHLGQGRQGQETADTDLQGRRLAQYWAVYFQLRAIEDPPPFLVKAEEELRNWLSPEGVDGEGRRIHLRRVK